MIYYRYNRPTNIGNPVVAAFTGAPPPPGSNRCISVPKGIYDPKFSGFSFFNSIYLSISMDWQENLRGAVATI